MKLKHKPRWINKHREEGMLDHLGLICLTAILEKQLGKRGWELIHKYMKVIWREPVQGFDDWILICAHSPEHFRS